ncbi:2-succinyl-5-enolpyruvyl-6-hydroxy-3-cyclohexene-1-carboxylic-acid synthase [Phormidium sp. CCY1219]|uniref:2-succinyl-5-enolpyruvyl-6-hydroxy-3- cyclohexene-1-carboxylic-acid synthase n=1 Tax=Phormidium sp. CCY1219 TaxID=2886104 RepID=UPI002D1ED6B0|nr:2-succinyl-5-enolpyruvyl-6-hydroxy-3-cyclohexene-1-carboxylic-acid synthase [Phormidium sp. CCY1219]MEB3829872.1 2-succinyl-5-enolpyruvyl-6-hydroxy-3-cyclohexene-1-carboxylic-acid synthase [Phormidium sp. CCY1219]
MPLDFRNTNSIWASILVETCHRLGLTTAVICPGSRSTPLTVAFATHPHIETLPILDERSAAFFALGMAKKTAKPVAIVCTSGTAGANFYPAIIEARESRVPLLILTADRPPELRHCHSGQTIDQIKLYGNYPNWHAELATPSLEISMLRYLRQTVIHAWEKTLFPIPGAVHLNLPFRDPLPPLPQPEAQALGSELNESEFFVNCRPLRYHASAFIPEIPLQEWQSCHRGIILGGVAQPPDPKGYCDAIAHLSQTLQFPVLAEGLSPLRNYSDRNPYLISTYDILLRNPLLAHTLAPQIVIQIGDLPTSKQLRAWLDSIQPIYYLIDPTYHNLDPLHGKTIHLRTSIEQLAAKNWQQTHGKTSASKPHNYLKLWCDAESNCRQKLDKLIASNPAIFEPKIPWMLSQLLPKKTPIFIANSMPVRDVEFFWKPGNRAIRPFFNRGANGIDGTLSTALGIAHHNQPSVMLTGDLALLHDTNGFLLRNKFKGHLTLVLINNNGGGIFEMLPISQFEPPFEEFFATPQHINFAELCLTYGVEHQLISSWENLEEALNPLPKTGIRVLELKTHRHRDAQWRKDCFQKLADRL